MNGLSKKLRLKQLKNTHYIFKDIPVRNEFGMIHSTYFWKRPKMESTYPLSCTGTGIFTKDKQT